MKDEDCNRLYKLATLGVGKNSAGIGYELYGNQGRENEKESRLTHEGSTVKAQEQLHTVSGRDTLLTGRRMEGRQVQAETGGNLRLESLQDRETYDSRNTGGGFSVSAGGGHVSGSVSAQKQILRSDYESVTEQAGIYAGDQGFRIQTRGNTHLKGAVIHSDAPAEKNRLETGTLSWEDVENRASYKADGQGVAFSATTRTGQEDRRKLNERGLYPEVVSTVKGRAESTTKAGISAGSIIIREGEKQIQPVKQLNRDTKNSLQKLATIFDKEKVQEKQELVNELSKVGNRAIHELAARKGWQEGSDEKILAHSIFGGVLSSLAGGKIATGSLAGGVGEYVNGRILAAKGKAWVEKHPDLVQAISAVAGSAVGAVTGESSIGSNVSLGGTKWNGLDTYQQNLNDNDSTIAQYLYDTINKDENEEKKQNGIYEILKSALEMCEYNDPLDVAEPDFINLLNQAFSVLKIEYKFVDDYGLKDNLEKAIHLYEFNTDREFWRLKGPLQFKWAVGIGIGGKVSAGYLGEANLVVDSHAEFSTDDNAKIVTEVQAFIKRQGLFQIGGSYKCIYYPKYKIVKYEPEFQINIKDLVNLTNYYDSQDVDFILEYDNAYYAIVGGEIGGLINLKDLFQGGKSSE